MLHASDFPKAYINHINLINHTRRRELAEEEVRQRVIDRVGYRSALGTWHTWDTIRPLPSKNIAVAPLVLRW